MMRTRFSNQQRCVGDIANGDTRPPSQKLRWDAIPQGVPDRRIRYYSDVVANASPGNCMAVPWLSLLPYQMYPKSSYGSGIGTTQKDAENDPCLLRESTGFDE